MLADQDVEISTNTGYDAEKYGDTLSLADQAEYLQASLEIPSNPDTVLSILDDDGPCLAEHQQDLDLSTGDTTSDTSHLGSPQSLRVEDSNALFEELRISIHRALGMNWDKSDNMDHRYLESYDTAGLRKLFTAFCHEEAELSGWNMAYLVSPSGSPSRPLHIKLNYPTFRTKQLEHGETADDTNPCMRLLMEKGLSASNAFWYEANFRRQTPTKSRHQEVDTKLWTTELKHMRDTDEEGSSSPGSAKS
jgi:hypothetical protein